MTYRENPKTAASGIVCCIPQKGACPVGCPDCFFQSGRSYLEPLADNLPNLPPVHMTLGRVVRMNDGNDSNVDRELVVKTAQQYDEVFFNTSMPVDLAGYPGPVVLTANPAGMTDKRIHRVDPVPRNLMFVRVRVDLWNLHLLDEAVEYYTPHGVPVIATLLAFYTETIPAQYADLYDYRKRTLNSYWCISQEGWDRVVARHRDNPLVYTCGKDATTYACSRCGTCLREFFATKERMAARD